MKTETSNKISAIYIRVSTDKQAEEGYSIEAQQEQLCALCVAKKWKDYKLYIDGGWSGSNINRPELENMMNDIKNGKIERVIVYKLDRLSRSQKDVLYLIEDIFIPNNVDFISLTENLDTSTAMGRAMIGILAAFAQLERENIRMRTRMGMKERVKTGHWMGGGRVPYGYDYDKEKGILVPNPNQAPIVKQLYKMYLEGYSCQGLANLFNLKYEKLVNQILVRKCNYGVIEYNGEIYQGLHEPIIDKETYDRTITEMKKRSNTGVTTSYYLLTGLLICGHCGAKLRYQKWGKKTKIFCYSQQKSKPYLVKDPNCILPRFDAEDIEQTVLEKLFLLKEKQFVSEKNENDIYSLLKKQREELKNKIKKLYMLFSDDDEDEILLETISEYKKQLEKCEKRIKQEEKDNIKLLRIQNYNNTVNTLHERWKVLTKQQQQHVVRSLVEKIIVNDNDIEVILTIE